MFCIISPDGTCKRLRPGKLSEFIIERMETELIKPDYLFEVSWEVCNKVGGIYTVIATKSLYLKSEFSRRHIMVGPDVWMNTENNPDFIEDPASGSDTHLPLPPLRLG